MVEHIDRALFDATPLIFATLIDEKPDEDWHMSRLSITRAEHGLVRSLQISFGDKMDRTDRLFLLAQLLL